MTLSELRVGTKVKDFEGGYTFLVGEHCHEGWNGTVLVSEKVISRQVFDAPKEVYTDAERRKFGSNEFPDSDLCLWLNDEKGFLSELSPTLRNAIFVSDVPYCRKNDNIDMFRAKVFLPSVAELGLSFVEHPQEGNCIEIFRDFRRRYAMPTASVVAAAPKGFGVLTENDSWCYWLRSSHLKHSSVQYVSHSHSPYVFFAANRDYVGVRPIFCVDPDLRIEVKNGEYWVCTEKGSV